MYKSNDWDFTRECLKKINHYLELHDIDGCTSSISFEKIDEKNNDEYY
jgi:hypothetical protein